MDEELKQYQLQIGEKEYWKQYHQLAMQAKQSKKRYSGNTYSLSKTDLEAVKAKYKNGVSKEIITQMIEQNCF